MGLYTKSQGTVAVAPMIAGNTNYGMGMVDIGQDAWSKDERPIRPRPLSNTALLITRTRNSLAKSSYGARRGPVAWCNQGFPDDLSVVHTSQSEAATLGLKAARKLGDGSVNAANALGEAGQSIAMIKNRVNQLVHGFRALKRGDMKGVAEAFGIDISNSTKKRYKGQTPADRLANGYLEMIYGWLPLVKDIHGGVEAVRKGLSEAGTPVRSQVGKKGTTATKLQEAMSRGDIASLASGLAASAGMNANVSNGNIRTLQELGLLNPASLIWELTSLSFSLDWLGPIGDILAYLTFDAGLDDVRGWVVVERRVINSFRGGTGEVAFIQQQIWRLASVSPIDPNSRYFKGAEPTIQRVGVALALMKQRM